MHKKTSSFSHRPSLTDEALEVVAIALLVVWLLGVAAGYTWDGSIHLLFLGAAIAIGFRLVHSHRGPPRTF